jgi:tetratricopeptide (TPR) repeat protein
MIRHVASQTITVTAFLLAVLSGGQAAKAQDKLPTPPPLKVADNAEPMDTAELQQQQRFLHGVAQAVIHLEANSDRTMDAIENSQITLTLDTMKESSRLAVLCNNGVKALNVFAQSLAGELQLNGKVNEAVCIGAGRDDDPFVMKFRLHYESGRTSLFSERPPELPFIVEKSVEDELEGNTAIFDRAEPSGDRPQDMPSEPSPQPVILNPRRSQTSHTIVQLPQGWTPVKLPDPIHADSAFGTFDSSVTFSDGTLTVDRKLVLKRDKVEVAELPTFQKWTETVQGGATLALRSTLYYPYRDASAGTEEQKKAADLIDEAYRDIQAHEFAKAEVALKQAEAIDPGHEILHENRGELAEARGDNVTALAEYRKELESFPDALFEMGSIAEAQRKLGDPDGSIVTLQRWMLANPNSNLAATSLMEQYHNMGRDDLAVRVGDDAMNTMTKDAKRGIDFLLTYGREQMLTGQSRNAKSTLEALLDLTVDDEIVNDAAYDLSEQGLSLDRAEQSVREALTEFDPSNPASALSISYADSSTERTSLLLATWDTLGWILYRKGAIQEAEGYVRAAWRSRQDIAISRHLGEILTAEEKPVDAMDVYTLGLAVIAGENAAGLAKNPDAIAVRDALAQLKHKGNAPTVTDPKAALLTLRTLDLGPATKPHGAKPYTVTLTASELVSYTAERDGAEEPNMVTDDELLAGFFPPGSKAALTRKGTIQCSKTCSLVFTP